PMFKWRKTEDEKARLARLEAQGNSLTTKWILLDSAARTVSYFHVTTHVLVVLSTGVSLGSLIYSGFHPHDKYGWKAITFILVLSFSSIIWNLVLYFLLLPQLTISVTSPDVAPSQKNASASLRAPDEE